MTIASMDSLYTEPQQVQEGKLEIVKQYLEGNRLSYLLFCSFPIPSLSPSPLSSYSTFLSLSIY